MNLVATYLLIILAIFFLVNFILWVYISGSPYSQYQLKPGESYVVNGRHYVLPNLKIVGHAILLKPEYIQSLRELFQKSTQLLDSLGIDWHVTGGTLLGAIRHNTIPMPFDDDCDIAVDNRYRTFLYSEDFTNAVKDVGLRPMYFVGNSATSASRHGSAVRLQNESGPFAKGCTLDIFFWKRVSTNIVSKLDGWGANGDIANKRETFKVDDVYPLQRSISIDGLLVNLPKNPITLLVQQYTSHVFTTIITRPLLISHFYPFYVFGIFFPPSPC